MIRLMAGATTFYTALTSLASTSHPNSPVFLFVSVGRSVILIKLALVALMILVSLKGHLNSSRARYAVGALGVLLIIVGGVLMFNDKLAYQIYDYFKPLDVLLLAEAGIVFSIVALSPAASQEKRPLEVVRPKVSPLPTA